MHHSIRRLTGLVLGLLLLLGSPVQAQVTDAEPPPRVTIPLEVAMIYHRLLNTQPSFDQLAANSPRLDSASEFGRSALVAEEKTKLEKVYAQIKRDTKIVIRQPVQISTLNDLKQTIELKGVDADTPFIFAVGSTNYGVFIRNAATMVSPLEAPFHDGVDWRGLSNFKNDSRMILAEITLKPMGADEQNFTTYQDDVVKPILADLVEIRLYDPQDTQRLLLNKRDEKAFGEKQSELGNLVEDDLKDEDALAPTPAAVMPVTPAKNNDNRPASAVESRL